MANSIGRVGYDAYCTKQGWRALNGVTLHLWEDNPREDIKAAWDVAGVASILYALDLMAAAGVTPAEAAAQLRAGMTIEEVCADSHPEDPDPRVMKQAHALLDAGLSARETAIELDAAGLRAPRRAPKAAGTLVSNLSDTMAQYERDLAAERAGLPLGPMSVGRPKG